jgi:hypothetical protein
MKKYLPLLLLGLSLLPLADLLHPGLPQGHDTRDHVARIANFYSNLAEGTIVPRWAGNLNWGYGHPVMMFLYPLPSYLASLFHLTGLDLVTSVKLVFATAFVASVFAMYAWAGLQWGVTAGFLAAILYGFAPYRFVDLYVRGAIGEHVAFVFPPLILWGILKLAQEKKKLTAWVLVIAVSTAGLLLSHNALSLMFLPIIILYVLYLYFFVAKKSVPFIVYCLWSLALGFGLSTFFWLPALVEGKYTLRDIVTAGEFENRFVSVRDLLYTRWSYGGGNELAKHLGIAQLVVVLGGAWSLWRQKIEKKQRYLGWALIAILLAASFLMTRPSLPIWESVTLLQKFQFPWRLLSLSVFAVAALAAWWKPKFWWVLATLAVVLTIPMWRAPSYIVRPETFYTGIYPGTTDTGESSPVWSVRFMEAPPAEYTEVIEGDAIIVSGQRTNTRHVYSVEATTTARIRENTLYFPGWKVLVDGKDTSIEFQDPANRGLMTYYVDPGTHRVDVQFEETKLRLFADYISLASLGILGVLGTMALWRAK